MRQYAMDVKFLPPAHGSDPSQIGRNVVAVVGCGGTGARLFPPLIKMLNPNDLILAIDDDIVEQRNTIRQHFSADDVGKYKAQVMEERYTSHDGSGPQVVAVLEKLKTVADLQTMTYGFGFGQSNHHRNGVICIGCVDDNKARGLMLGGITQISANVRATYIDVGNENKTGQAVIAYSSGYRMAAGSTLFILPSNAKVALPDSYFLRMNGASAFPDLFGAASVEESTNPDAGLNCPARLDLQTVMVNQLAASAAINLLTPFLYPGVALRNMGVVFSTYNTMSPILPKSKRTIGDFSSKVILSCDPAEEKSGE